MRVAFVDPSKTNRAAITRLLQSGGHEVLLFSDGLNALDRLKGDASVEALITSAELPGLSGLEVCWEARLAASASRPIYVLMMSSKTDIVAQALDCGADDFIRKPPSAPELYAKLRTAERVGNLHRELARLANRDPLTGVYNRRGFFEEASKACLRAGEESPLSAILFDIDHFKEVNDLYGHATGDAAIKSIASEAGTSSDLVGRLGGDEFSVLLEGHSMANAMQVANAMQRSFAAMRIATSDGFAALTCSLGVAPFLPSDSIDDLINRADLALYRAKSDGRNCVAKPPSGAWLRENPLRGRPIARNRVR